VRTPRILIVDDDRQNRMLLEVLLSADGYQMDAVASGEEALLAVERLPPDVILLDIMMPGMDGNEVARRLKSQSATQNIPIIMITALNDQQARLQGLKSGAEDFLSKPVDRAELSVRVKNLVRLRAFQEEQLQFKDNFLSHVSHELRSPLTAIKQFSSILLAGLAGELNPEQRTYQQIVLRNIHQLQAMIDDLLEVTRLETGKLSIAPEPVSCAQAVADSFDTLRASAHLRDITLTCEIPETLPRLYADPMRLRQMLIILLDNAIKFSRSGGTVHITLQVCPVDDHLLQVSVTDTGDGMTAEVVSRVFDRMYQSAEPVEHSRKGLGLGLYICRELVVRQGGTIAVVSKPGVGSTFSFTLPPYTFTTMLSPLLTDSAWPADQVALVVVDVNVQQWASTSGGANRQHDLRAVVQRCLMPNLDILLSSVQTSTGREQFFVAAFADERGVSILARRIRGELDRLCLLRSGQSTVSVKLLQPGADALMGPRDGMLAAMSAVFETALTHHKQNGNKAHEQQEDPRR